MSFRETYHFLFQGSQASPELCLSTHIVYPVLNEKKEIVQEIIQTVWITQFFKKAKARKLLCSPTPLQLIILCGCTHFCVDAFLLDTHAEWATAAAQAAQSSQVLRPECNPMS